MAQQAASPKEGFVPHALPPLPYALDALEPYIDAKTMEIHHDKHHGAYVNNLNKALEGHAGLQTKSTAPFSSACMVKAAPCVVRELSMITGV